MKGGRKKELRDRLEVLDSTRSNSGKRMSSLGAFLFGLLIVAGVLGVIYTIYSTAMNGNHEAGKPVEIRVVKGDSVSSVARKLEDSGVIESALVFKAEAQIRQESTEIKPGEYRFRPGEDSSRILARLTAGKAPPTFTVTIPEGLTLEQTAREVDQQSGITAKSFEAAARQTNYGYAFLQKPGIKTTEGFLFPKQYEFEKNETARQVVDRLLEQYLLETEGMKFGKAEKKLGLSEYQLLTVASLIERESANSDERPKIASVIYNRLHADMPLQIDASVQYALGHPKENLSLRDLKIDSPYNTYENKGLPPGPICSPSRESIKAALNPAHTDYLYYVLDASGKHHSFTSNYDEFLQMKARAGR